MNCFACCRQIAGTVITHRISLDNTWIHSISTRSSGPELDEVQQELPFYHVLCPWVSPNRFPHSPFSRWRPSAPEARAPWSRSVKIFKNIISKDLQEGLFKRSSISLSYRQPHHPHFYSHYHHFVHHLLEVGESHFQAVIIITIIILITITIMMH